MWRRHQGLRWWGMRWRKHFKSGRLQWTVQSRAWLFLLRKLQGPQQVHLPKRHQSHLRLHPQNRKQKPSQNLLPSRTSANVGLKSGLVKVNTFYLFRVSQNLNFVWKRNPGRYCWLRKRSRGKGSSVGHHVRSKANYCKSSAVGFPHEGFQRAFEFPRQKQNWEGWSSGNSWVRLGDDLPRVLLDINILPQNDRPWNSAVHPADLLCEDHCFRSFTILIKCF